MCLIWEEKEEEEEEDAFAAAPLSTVGVKSMRWGNSSSSTGGAMPSNRWWHRHAMMSARTERATMTARVLQPVPCSPPRWSLVTGSSSCLLPAPLWAAQCHQRERTLRWHVRPCHTSSVDFQRELAVLRVAAHDRLQP